MLLRLLLLVLLPLLSAFTTPADAALRKHYRKGSRCGDPITPRYTGTLWLNCAAHCRCDGMLKSSCDDGGTTCVCREPRVPSEDSRVCRLDQSMAQEGKVFDGTYTRELDEF